MRENAWWNTRWLIWPWFSFTTTRLNLGVISQVEPGHSGSMLNRPADLTVLTYARVSYRLY